jgi:hypothetical protein
VVLDRGNLEQGAHRTRHAPMPTDHFADITWRDLKTIHDYAVFVSLYDFQFVGMIDQRVSHVLDELSGHSVGPVSPATWVGAAVGVVCISAPAAT